MKKYLLFLFLCFCLSSQLLLAQKYIKGEVLIKLYSASNLEKFEKELANAELPLQLKTTILEEQQIYLYNFNADIHSHEYIITTLKNLKSCQMVQNNHYIEHRITPNDTYYPNQWQYNNNGLNGGVANADIDADLAWDISTGGNTALGDTIVICIIDDGVDTNHIDLKANLWKNTHEIPNNGIDDDANGYIDDIRGWNTLDNDNNIYGGTHGTPVAGIIGAVGNNNIGVAGVNWNSKLMIIKGGGNEAQALLAYAYALKMRKLYNETAGQLGAFVVATNSSWGINNLHAADAPIWCDFYDILGEEGILSVAATSNRNVNVDIVGDMPTTCTSPYLITVTNLLKNDIKETTAGFGAQSIDIGAYGTGVYTIKYNSDYDYFSGTSAAAPHVTGVIGLLYASPCLALSANAQWQAANTALEIKDFILNGGSNNTSLQNISTTGKRLNAYGALLQINNYNCTLADCHSPLNIAATFNNINNSFTLNWNAALHTNNYEILFGIDSNNLQSYSTTDTFFSINNVTPCAIYTFKIINHCSLDNMPYSSRYFEIQSNNCCLAPSLLSNMISDSSNISFSLAQASDVSLYTIFWKREFGISWDSLVTTDSIINLSNLEPCINYQIQIKSNCPSNNLNNISPIFSIKTKGCALCIDGNYCHMKGENNNYEWISNVTINNFSHNSGKDSNGYNSEGLDLAASTIDLRQTVSFSLSLQKNLSTPNWQWFIWIDLNRDGSFSNSNELVYSSGIVTDTTISGTLNIPRLGIVGNTRMRVAMRWGSNTVNICENIPYGEVQDYCIILDDVIAVEQEIIEQNLIHIYPNPFDKKINIVFENALKTEKLHLYLHDILGREVYNTNLNSMQSNFEINTSFLHKGAYILSLQSEKGQILSRKLIK